MRRTETLILILAVLMAAGCSGPDRKEAAAVYIPTPVSAAAGRLKLPESGAYAGAYVDFGFSEDEVTIEGLQKFDRLVGREQAIIALSSDWGNQNFPSRNVDLISRYGAMPIVFWLPWDRPQEDNVKQARFFLDDILSGKWDSYIDLWAAGAARFAKPLFVSFALEPNGNWFPWSGVFYGGENPGGTPGSFQGPEKFKSVYRYVVSRVRRKANNVLWVFHVNNTSDPEQAWNDMANYYPGSEFADWIGMSAYGIQYPNQGWVTLDMAIITPYTKLAAIDEKKPLMLAEWGIGEFPRAGSKGDWLKQFFTRIPAECPRVKAAVFWHERWQNGDLSYSNLRVNSSPASLAAFREGIKDNYWISRIVYAE